ncbi:MAG: T9SS type A sorting domain-containing protein [Paludibacteraceae bacterium]
MGKIKLMNLSIPKSIALFVFTFVAGTQPISAQTGSYPDEDGYTLSTQATIDFKVTTLNTEWLSCATYGPDNDNLQINNIVTLINTVNPDVIALQEVGTSTSYTTIDTLVKKLGSSTWAGKIITWSADNCSQNQGVIFKKSKVQLVNSSLIKDGGTSTNWSSGRYPALYNLSFVVGAGSVSISLINIHSKAYNDETSYNKRKGASEGLKALLDGSSYNSRNIILLGDFNDYLVGTQCTTKTDSPYKNFTDDTSNYLGLTKGLVDPYYSSPVIDNIVISNELFSAYVAGSVMRETAATQKITNYTSTTTDHTPISATFRFTVPTGLQSLFQEANISLYPNPASDCVFIRSDVGVQRVAIYDLTGSLVLTLNSVTQGVDISQLPRGIYIVQLNTEKGIYLQKIMKK